MINHYDCKIHKRLDEAKRVYICPARGNGKPYNQLELYVDLMTQNKDVKIIRTEDVRKAVDFSEALIDKDLYYHHEPPWLKDALDTYFEDKMKKWLGDYKMNWEPSIITDTMIEDPRFWNQWNLWNTTYHGFITLSKDDTE